MRNKSYRKIRKRIKLQQLKKSSIGIPPTKDDDLPNLYWGVICEEYPEKEFKPPNIRGANTKKILKKQARRKARYTGETFSKSNKYRRVYDLWWNLD